ncbi:MAG: DNA polymerase III subunit alpha [Bacteroidota bacterium]
MYLNTRSYYSLRFGTMSIEDIVKNASENHIKTLALTDINATTGIFDFVKLCTENNIKPVAGIEFREGNSHLFTAIAKNNEGFKEINDFLSSHNINKTPLDNPVFSNSYIIYSLNGNIPAKLKENEFIGIRPTELSKVLFFNHKHSRLVIFSPVTFKDRIGYFLHRHLRAIDNNILLSKLSPEMLAYEDEMLYSPDYFIEKYQQFPQIISNSMKLLDNCSFEFNFRQSKNKKTFTGNIYEDKLLLEKLSREGLVYRYGKNNSYALERLNKELEVINKLGFSAYFLITWDIIKYSMSMGFYHVGRGSGANSIVAYCLKITDVDPIELDLYFERFINPKRTNPPDFDIDFSWKDRDTIHKYIFDRYPGHAALLGTTPEFKYNSIVRELSKVYGLPKDETDRFLDYPNEEIHKNSTFERILKISALLKGFPNIRSIHAGGVLISENPITCYSALDLPPKGLPTVQWDMYTAESIGFEKFDILSQRGIGHINECVEIINRNHNIEVDIFNIAEFKKDENLQKQLISGETIGCFYIESPAMRGLIKKLKCNNYLCLVAASSIIRPGVSSSGMMKEYIYRFNNPEKFRYNHPIMEEQLKETYGVMVYQEDVLKICYHFAGLDLADADVLRRAMSGKHRSKTEFKRIVDKFFSNCKQRGYSDNLTNEVWRQIESFAGYSFSKAHSASYAAESFQSLYLKTYYPLEFMVAVINNYGGFYRSWVYFNEAQRWGASIELPCVNKSDFKTNIQDRTVYIGFAHLSNLENKTAGQIIKSREQYGDFLNLEDFLQRVHTGMEQLILLIKTGAFRFTGKSKAELYWNAHFILKKTPLPSLQNQLFKQKTKNRKLPDLCFQTKLEDAYDEIELLDFPVSLSGFDMLKTKFRGEITARKLILHKGKTVKITGKLSTIKYVRTKRKEIMNFGTFIDAEGNFFDTVHFPDSLKKYPFRGYGVYLILGKIVEEYGYASIEVEKLAKLELLPDPRKG